MTAAESTITPAPVRFRVTVNARNSTRWAPPNRTPLARPPATFTFAMEKSVLDHSVKVGKEKVCSASWNDGTSENSVTKCQAVITVVDGGQTPDLAPSAGVEVQTVCRGLLHA